MSLPVPRRAGTSAPSLPLGSGIVYDPFAGSGSTLAAAQAVGYHAVGTERDAKYYRMGCKAVTGLAALKVKENA
jgi:DNA modification methylase